MLGEQNTGEIFFQRSGLFDNRIPCEWIATANAAAFLDISPNALRIMVHRGKIKAHKLGNRLRFRIRDLRAALQQRS